MIKKIVLCFLALMTSSLFSQEKEWRQLTDLLQKEAYYFSGKNGFIRLGKSEYNTFAIEKFSVNDTLVNFQMKLQDRFGNEGSEQVLEETIVLHPEMTIQSAKIVYGYRFYFEDFPQSQFLILEFDENYGMIHQIISAYKNLKTGEENKSVMEETTYKIYFPIRKKSREKIFKMIDYYQNKTLKIDLENDKKH